MEKQRLSTHMYQQSDDVHTLRSLDNLHLIDFIELTLKGNDGFETAMNNLLKSNLADYMKKYLVLLPRDWPAQFFMCRVIYRKLADIEDPLLSLVPILGALHVNLNATEDVFIAFNSFFREM